MGEGDTLANALVGALVTIFATPIAPLAPILGGAVSGYLEGGTSRDGVTVGALAGVIALVPLVILLVLVGNLFLFVFAVSGDGGAAIFGGLGLLAIGFVIVAGLVYVVLLSALGGWAGHYLKTETDL